ncbi:hypothetical protein BDZ89DRAFT_730294 [Hymenopellis radicata]|nr:hypothetical protein BDZ89DRAFT_730294 [Hymenopellis radicata]
MISPTQCSICLDPYNDAASIPCGHIFCSRCLQGLSMCAKCRAPFSRGLKLSSEVRRVFIDFDSREMDELTRQLQQASEEISALKSGRCPTPPPPAASKPTSPMGKLARTKLYFQSAMAFILSVNTCYVLLTAIGFNTLVFGVLVRFACLVQLFFAIYPGLSQL